MLIWFYYYFYLFILKRFPNANPNDPAPIYDLIAVANHKGGVTGGHYYTYAKSPQDGM